jgi:hypothetical protein
LLGSVAFILSKFACIIIFNSNTKAIGSRSLAIADIWLKFSDEGLKLSLFSDEKVTLVA